jgi:hypothetical protein
MEQFKLSDGKARLAVTRAMGSIRRREKANAEAGTLRFRVSQARASQDGQRHFSLVLSAEPTRDLSALTPLDFALWEAGELIEKYEVKLTAAPVALAAGFVAPRFMSTDDPYGQAINLALKRSSGAKRADDMWRIDRYSMEPPKEGADAPREPSSFLPYDDSLATQEVKMRHCFIASPDILSKVIAAEVPRDRVAPDLAAAIQRQCEAISKHSGKRHVFVFLQEAALLEDSRVSALKALVANERIVLHGFGPGSVGSAAFRELCLSIPDGTFNDVAPDGVPDALTETYALLMNGCEISYEFGPGAEAQTTLKVSSRFGSGQVDIPWQSDAPVETAAPVEAAVP